MTVNKVAQGGFILISLVVYNKYITNKPPHHAIQSYTFKNSETT